MLHGGIAMTTVVEGMGLEQAKRILGQYGITVRLINRGNGKRTLELSKYWSIEIVEALLCSLPDPDSVQQLLAENSPQVAQRISFFGGLKAVECINLSDSPFYLEEANFEPLSDLPALETLHLRSCQLRRTHLETLKSQSLSSLNLHGNSKLEKDCLPILACNLPNLKTIVIGGTCISKAAVEEIFGKSLSVEL